LLFSKKIFLFCHLIWFPCYWWFFLDLFSFRCVLGFSSPVSDFLIDFAFVLHSERQQTSIRQYSRWDPDNERTLIRTGGDFDYSSVSSASTLRSNPKWTRPPKAVRLMPDCQSFGLHRITNWKLNDDRAQRVCRFGSCYNHHGQTKGNPQTKKKSYKHKNQENRIETCRYTKKRKAGGRSWDDSSERTVSRCVLF
jgi:hypothetical protein